MKPKGYELGTFDAVVLSKPYLFKVKGLSFQLRSVLKGKIVRFRWLKGILEIEIHLRVQINHLNLVQVSRTSLAGLWLDGMFSDKIVTHSCACSAVYISLSVMRS